jgi:hypothetical protein
MPWSLYSPKPRQVDGEVLKTYWTIVGPTRCPIRCALHRTSAGFELRTYLGAHNLLYFLPILSEDQGRDQAAAWRRAMLDVAGFTDANQAAESGDARRLAHLSS